VVENIIQKFKTITADVSNMFKFRCNINRPDIQFLIKSFVLKEKPFGLSEKTITIDSNWRYIIEATFDFVRLNCQVRLIDGYADDD